MSMFSVLQRFGQRFAAARRLYAGCLSLCLCVLLSSCLPEKSPEPESDLSLAEKAQRYREYAEAEMYFERYLRKNPEGDERWNVWQQLLDISLNIRQDTATAADYLEIMLVEFAGDPEKQRKIRMTLADLYLAMRAYGRAQSLWEALAADPGLPDEERADVYQHISRNYMRRLEFTVATDMLDRCLKLDVREATKADCLYTMAETLMLMPEGTELFAAEQTLRKIIAMPDATPELHVLALFMLGDVAEQQNHLPEAVRLFESVRDTYPNTRVVEVRLLNIKERMNKEPLVVPKRR